jgi:hypothetical protein
VQVHHIIPEEHGGPDTIDNAAPLCPNCHDYFGANPTKRKEIKHMRDWWYQKVEQMYPNKYVTTEQLGVINSKLEEIRQGQSSALSDLKKVMKFVSNKMIDGISTKTADTTASGIINTSAAVSVREIAPGIFSRISQGEMLKCTNHNCGYSEISGISSEISIGGPPPQRSCPQCGGKLVSNSD